MTIAPDDIVRTHADASANARPPLLVLEPLRAFLDEHGLGEGDIEASPIGEGHSNVTYLIDARDSEMVLRRPPRPPLPPSAHDVFARRACLEPCRTRARAYPRCSPYATDPATIGCPFYVMDRIQGEVIVASVPAALDTPAERRRIAEELIDALAEIHAVDWRAAGLEDFGRPTGYLERQLRRFSGLWEVNKTREIGEVERVGRWLAENLPELRPRHDRARRLPPGKHDLRRRAPARLEAVLDWEMATIGDPLADLGYLCMMWTDSDDPVGGMREHLGGVTRQPRASPRARS